MKTMIRKSIVSLAMTALLALTVAPASVSAQEPPSLAGVWNSEVTLTDCNGNTLRVFRATVMFIQDGSLVSTDNAPPTSHGPGLGRWRHLSGRNYGALFQFFNFNPDGSYAGLQKIRRKITLSADGNSYTSVVTFESFDPNGNLLFSGCGSESATRLRPFQPADL